MIRGYGVMWLRKRARQLNHEMMFIAILCIFASVCLMFMIYTGADIEQHTSDDASRYKKQIKREASTNDKGFYTWPRILCWIMTSPTNIISRAVHVKRTWGRRCDKTLYFSSETDVNFPSIGLNVSEGKQHLTAKSQKAFRYIFDKHFSDAEWFVKADDNTYVIVENLKYFLSNFSTYEPLYFGQHFVRGIEGGYMSGGAAYVLSKEALKRLAIQGQNHVICRQDGGAEDIEIGKCLHNTGVIAGNSYDSKGRSRFHCFDPATHLLGKFPSWYYKFDEHAGLKGEESMSDYPVSFHYIKPDDMHVLHYFIYKFKLYQRRIDEFPS